MDLNDLFDDSELGATVSGSLTGGIVAKVQHTKNLAIALAKAKQAGANAKQLDTIRRAKPPAVANIAKASIPQIRNLMKITPAQVAALKRMTAAQAAALKRATPAQVAALKRSTAAQRAALAKATPAQRAALARATPQQMANLAKSTPAQRAALARATPQQLANLAKASPEQLAALKRATPEQLANLAKATPAQLAALRMRRAPVAVAAKKFGPISSTCPGAYRQLACTAGVGGKAGLSILQHIKDRVDLANTRALATSEHNEITNTQAFRRAVLKGLRARQRACR